MPSFTCKYNFGDMVSFKWGVEQLTATIQGVYFIPDKEPRYVLEGHNGENWTERYFEMFERDLTLSNVQEGKP